LPCIGQDFYARAFTPSVAIGSVEYDYAGKQVNSRRWTFTSKMRSIMGCEKNQSQFGASPMAMHRF